MILSSKNQARTNESIYHIARVEIKNMNEKRNKVGLPRTDQAKIADFCHDCDKLGRDGVCTGVTIGRIHQARYAAREWCGWAVVDGVNGTMTNKGFKPGR